MEAFIFYFLCDNHLLLHEFDISCVLFQTHLPDMLVLFNILIPSNFFFWISCPKAKLNYIY